MDTNRTVIETRLLMELTASQTALDAVMAFLQKKKDMYCGMSHEDVEMLLVMFGKENKDA